MRRFAERTAIHSVLPHYPVLLGGGGHDGEDKEGGEGTLQGAQLAEPYLTRLLNSGSQQPVLDNVFCYLLIYLNMFAYVQIYFTNF